MNKPFINRLWPLLLCSAALGLAAQDSPLTLRQAIDTALGKNPEVTMAHAGQQSASVSSVLARTALLPQLNFTEDISRGDDPVYAFGSRLRQRSFSAADLNIDALNRPNPISDFSTRFSGQWMLFDSMRTERMIQGADLMRKSADSSTAAVNQKVVFDVVRAYEAVLFAQRRVAVARHEVDTADSLLASAADHVKAGLAVDSDRMLAEVNQAARKQELITAEGDLEVAWVELRAAMGVEDLAPVELKPIEPHEFAEVSLDEQLATALKTRPDLEALKLAQSAESKSVSAARSSFLPHIAAYGNWEQDRDSFGGTGGNNWVAGVQLGIDIFPAQKKYELAREVAAKRKVDAEVDQYRQQLKVQVSQAHIHLATATRALATAKAALEQSEESLRIIRNRYNAGLATINDLLRAEDAQRESESNYWNAVYGNAMAYAETLFATGTLTPDAAEVLQ